MSIYDEVPTKEEKLKMIPCDVCGVTEHWHHRESLSCLDYAVRRMKKQIEQLNYENDELKCSLRATESLANSRLGDIDKLRAENEELKNCLARISGTTHYMEEDEESKAKCMNIIRDIIGEVQGDE